jgi:hypothetical protein
VIYLINAFRTGNKATAGDQTQTKLFPVIVLLATLSAAAYVAAGVLYKLEPASPIVDRNPSPVAPKPPVSPPTTQAIWRGHAQTVGGLLAILGISLPFFVDLTRMRARRIWALARLSFKEAIRRRVLWVFLAFLLVFLFPPKWFLPVKPENEVRDSIAVIDYAMFAIMLFAFGLLAAFSIPTDLRTQTMHTIVTKPVERFEIVLGRFLGYVGLARRPSDETVGADFRDTGTINFVGSDFLR